MSCATCKYEVPNCSRNWWVYREIIHCRPQTLWVLENLGELEDGTWPPEPSDSGYTGGSGRHVGNASFERPTRIAGEVTKRLSMCAKIDGAMVYQLYVLRLSVEDIAKSFNCTVEEVNRRSKSALAFITGYRRKRRDYSKFVFDWENRRKVPKKVLTR